jgi:hypothetical protein
MIGFRFEVGRRLGRRGVASDWRVGFGRAGGRRFCGIPGLPDA